MTARADPIDPDARVERINPALPKVELHLHLEGAAPPAFIRALAQAKHADIATVFDEEGGYRFADFPGFLKAYHAASSVLTTPEDYAQLTACVLEERASDGVIYLETFVCPLLCGGGDRSAWLEYVAAIEEAARPLAQTIPLRIIATAIRDFGPEAAKRAALAAAESAGAFVTGFGLAGDETRGRAQDFAWAFDCAREAGLALTAHAGEIGGPESIRSTLAALRPRRLGHGVRAVEDPALVETLAEQGIVLEVCVGSNLALKLYPSLRAHPVARLRDNGVMITLSTDDPSFFRTSLRQEYEALAHAFGWTEEDFRAINKAAANAAFCDETTRKAVLARIEEHA